MRINLNDLARTVTLLEKKKVSIPIGQVKEVMKITLTQIAKHSDKDIIKLMERYRK